MRMSRRWLFFFLGDLDVHLGLAGNPFHLEVGVLADYLGSEQKYVHVVIKTFLGKDDI
jgi:hypothetical protein